MAKEKKKYLWFPIIKNRPTCPVCDTQFVTSKLMLTLYNGLNTDSIDAQHKVHFCNSCHTPFLTKQDVSQIEVEHPGYHLETGNFDKRMSRPYLEKKIITPALPIKNIAKGTLLFIGEKHHHMCGTEHMIQYNGIIHGTSNLPVKISECQKCKRQIISPLDQKHIKKTCPEYLYVPDNIAWKNIFPTQKTIHLLNINQYSKAKCPTCRRPLTDTKFYLKNDENPMLQQKSFKQCPHCNHTFGRITSFKKYYSSYKFSKEFYQEETFRTNEKHIVIKTGDFLTRHNLQYCINNNHSMEDITARIRMVNTTGHEFNYDVPAIRCDTCGKLFLLETEYQKIQEKGVPLCAIVENEYWKSTNDKSKPWNESDAKGSVMYVHGYNVAMVNNLSAMQRHTILRTLIKDDILNKGQILSHLDTLIKRAGNTPNLQKAKEKWILDRNYILTYDKNTETVIANSITHRTYHDKN